ncbi:MAG: hypothetical protein J5I90_12205 [Caldilineales bacterium]|nr:hypothetical protein [Caldilineales bacterium]
MRKTSVLLIVLALLLLLTSVASAAGPDLEPFSTTGYTTNLVPNPYFDPGQLPSLTNPPLLPSEFVPLPTGHIKFHISAQGGPAVDNDTLCTALFGAPCQLVCQVFAGQACGTGGYFDGGSFTFEEWGLYYPLPSPPFNALGANYGLMTIATDTGEADMRFGGLAVLDSINGGLDAVGSFQVLDGSGEYKRLKGQGDYFGDADLVFTVDYTPAETLQGCAAFGGDLKVKNDKIEWQIENAGAGDIALSNVSVWWPAGATLDRVKYEGKSLFDGENDASYASLDVSTDGLALKSGQQRKLSFEFDKKLESDSPSDYTILVEFDNGCAVPFVAF